ncbi:MAG: hypothetical protein AAB870_00150 [Patescibacteria group bacterium]
MARIDITDESMEKLVKEYARGIERWKEHEFMVYIQETSNVRLGQDIILNGFPKGFMKSKKIHEFIENRELLVLALYTNERYNKTEEEDRISRDVDGYRFELRVHTLQRPGPTLECTIKKVQ